MLDGITWLRDLDACRRTRLPQLTTTHFLSDIPDALPQRRGASLPPPASLAILQWFPTRSNRGDVGLAGTIFANNSRGSGDRRRPGGGRAKLETSCRDTVWQTRSTLEGWVVGLAC
jgi:hypothetical protein